MTVEEQQIQLSVIMPTYNRSRLLRECLTSLSAQDYPGDRVEVIIVDDGSSDNTEEVVNSFASVDNLRYIRSKINL